MNPSVKWQQSKEPLGWVAFVSCLSFCCCCWLCGAADIVFNIIMGTNKQLANVSYIRQTMSLLPFFAAPHSTAVRWASARSAFRIYTCLYTAYASAVYIMLMCTHFIFIFSTAYAIPCLICVYDMHARMCDTFFSLDSSSPACICIYVPIRLATVVVAVAAAVVVVAAVIYTVHENDMFHIVLIWFVDRRFKFSVDVANFVGSGCVHGVCMRPGVSYPHFDVRLFTSSRRYRNAHCTLWLCGGAERSMAVCRLSRVVRIGKVVNR